MKMTEITFDTLEDYVGQRFEYDQTLIVDQDRINRFADVSLDDQWIHVDVERAKSQSPFGGTIAHGFLTLSLVATMIGKAGIFPENISAVINYGLDSVRFLSPVPSGSSLEIIFEIKSVEPKANGQKLVRLAAETTITGTNKPVMVADFLALILP